MEPYLIYIFAGNFLLVLLDASIGYHVAPFLFRMTPSNAGLHQGGIRGIRILLSAVVALYTFFSCLAFFRGNGTLLLIVTAIILIDIVSQLLLTRRFRR